MAITMNKLVGNLMDRTKLSEDQVRQALTGLVSELQEELKTEGGSVTITGLGTFKSVKKGDRMARNPRTGDQSYVEPYLKVSFRSSNKMSDMVNDRR